MKVHCMCRCERERKEAEDRRLAYEEEQRQIDNLKQLSLIDAKSRNVRFSTYQVNEENAKVFGIAKRYVENFPEMYSQNQGMLFWGDVGTGKSYTAAAIANELMEKVYDIIDSRYRSGKPAIFTTNLTMGQMKECTDIRYNRIYDRIFEMCYPVKFSGLSWRKREAAGRYASMKKILEG